MMKCSRYRRGNAAGIYGGTRGVRCVQMQRACTRFLLENVGRDAAGNAVGNAPLNLLGKAASARYKSRRNDCDG